MNSNRQIPQMEEPALSLLELEDMVAHVVQRCFRREYCSNEERKRPQSYVILQRCANFETFFERMKGDGSEVGAHQLALLEHRRLLLAVVEH